MKIEKIETIPVSIPLEKFEDGMDRKNDFLSTITS